MLAMARRAVAMILRRLRRDGRTRRCISTALSASGIGVKRKWAMATTAGGSAMPHPDRPARRMARIAKSAPGFDPTRSLGESMPPICPKAACSTFAKILLWVARQGTAPALHNPRRDPRRAGRHTTPCKPRREATSAFVRVSCEKRLSRIEQRTSARASLQSFRVRASRS